MVCSPGWASWARCSRCSSRSERLGLGATDGPMTDVLGRMQLIHGARARDASLASAARRAFPSVAPKQPLGTLPDTRTSVLLPTSPLEKHTFQFTLEPGLRHGLADCTRGRVRRLHARHWRRGRELPRRS